MNNYFTKKQLYSLVDWKTGMHEVATPGGGSIVCTAHGGRVLGIFPEPGCINPLWVNNAFQDVLEMMDWNTGGDRFWISPEKRFFYAKPGDWEGWFCPRGLDPAYYEFTSKGKAGCTLESDLSFKDMQSGDSFSGVVAREISVASCPVDTPASHAGYSVKESCSITGEGFSGNPWSLTQVVSGGPPNPGTVMIPTRPGAKPLSYFREIPDDRVKVLDDHVSFKIDVADIFKLAIRPEDIDYSAPTRMGYLLESPGGEGTYFLLKESSDVAKNQDACEDVSRDHADCEIGVLQSYNSESPVAPTLMFGEMEFQLEPFAQNPDGTMAATVQHEFHAFLGTPDDILGIVEKLLGIKDPYQF